MNANTQTNRQRPNFAPMLTGVALAILVVAGCSLTQKEDPKLADGKCALIPPDICKQLTPGPKDGAGLRYIRPNVNWTKYNKWMLTPVTLWSGEESKLTGAQQQTLSNYLYSAVDKSLSAKFTVVHEHGPDVLRIQLAISDAEKSTPVLRSISMFLPQAFLVGTVKRAITGSYPFVGTAQGEAVITDSDTGEVLAAGVDRRIGGGAVRAGAEWVWGDVENAMDKWAEIITNKFSRLHQGLND